MELHILYACSHDPKTPWYAKALLLLVIAYTVSPIDFIPDFIPILGLLDDIILLPLGIALVRLLIPKQLYLTHASQITAFYETNRGLRKLGVLFVLTLWIISGCIAFVLLYLYTVS
ncbi:MAG: DUF1232 domain-containing protein [bacterium]|nr:DUF1232 domain-containing protein [bacterium]